MKWLPCVCERDAWGRCEVNSWKEDPCTGSWGSWSSSRSSSSCSRCSQTKHMDETGVRSAITSLFCCVSLLQLDANLIEGEPYNRLAQKNKRRLNVARQNSIRERGETSFKKNLPRPTASVWGPVECHWYTDFFTPTLPPMGQKTSLVNFKHKITTSAHYTYGIGTGYMSHDKEISLHGKILKNNFKINQSN